MRKLLERIGIWGDSLLQGVVLDEAQGRYSVLKETFVSALEQITGACVNNHSRFGCTAPRGMRFLARALDTDGGFQAAVLEFGGNDCDFDWAEVAREPEREHTPKTPLDEFARCYAGMIDVLRARGVTPVLVSLPPLHAERYFAWITRNGINRENVLKWLGDVQHIYRWHERYSNAVAALARRHACPFVDIRDAFLSERDLGSLMCADGIHPNRKGHALVRRVFAEAAAELV